MSNRRIWCVCVCMCVCVCVCIKRESINAWETAHTTTYVTTIDTLEEPEDSEEPLNKIAHADDI